jgi:hypothetical protein
MYTIGTSSQIIIRTSGSNTYMEQHGIPLDGRGTGHDP